MITHSEVSMLHEKMGIKYPLPNLDSPLIVLKEEYREEDKLIAACAVKLVGEAFLWIDPEATTRKKIEGLRRVARAAEHAARDRSIEDVSAWIPPEIEPRFAHMLFMLGWKRSPWPCWSRII